MEGGSEPQWQKVTGKGSQILLDSSFCIDTKRLSKVPVLEEGRDGMSHGLDRSRGLKVAIAERGGLDMLSVTEIIVPSSQGKGGG